MIVRGRRSRRGRWATLALLPNASTLTFGLLLLHPAAPSARTHVDALIEEATHRREGDDARASLRLYERAAQLLTGTSDHRTMAEIRFGQSRAAHALGRFQEALAFSAESYREAQLAGDLDRQAWAIEGRGNALFYLDRIPDALDAFKQSLALMRAAGDEYGEAMAAKDAGITYKYVGDFDEALRYLEDLPPKFEAMNRREEMASTLENIGTAYETLGDHDRALEIYEKTLAEWKSLGNAPGVQGVLTRIGELYLDSSDPEYAARCFREALAASPGPLIDRSWILAGLGNALAEQGEIDEAIRIREEALRLDRQMRSPLSIAADLRALARFLLERDRARAFAYLQESLALYEESAADMAWNGYMGFARAYHQSGDLDRAIDCYTKAMDRLESVRRRLTSQELKVSLISAHESLYAAAMEAAMARYARDPEKGDDRRAFEILERARARTMAEAIANASALERPGAGALAPPLNAGQTLTLSATQSLLDSDTALIGYFFGEQHVFVLTVTRRGLHADRLPVSVEALSESVRNYVELLSNGSDRIHWEPISRRLYSDLLAPILARLPERVTRLIVIPDGVLHYLPFETLLQPTPSSGLRRFLLEDYTLSYVPSASVLGELARDPPQLGDPPSDLLVFADPAVPPDMRSGHGAARAVYEEDRAACGPLPYSEVEARMIAQYARLGSEVLTGSAASEDRLKNGPANRFRILHFATHGVISERRPGHAALVLAAGPGGGEDGLLQAGEIYSMRLPCDLVVMSACRTARGKIAEGEGVQGLARAFFCAGARTVVASLWTVDDRATASLMADFYRHLAGGQSKAGALRAAKLDALRSDPAGNPRLWAPFVLLGDPDGRVELSGLAWWRRYRWAIASFGLIAALGALLSPAIGRRRERRQFTSPLTSP